MNLGRLLIVAGLVITGVGIVIFVLSKFNLPIGRLPGDQEWRTKNTVVYFPWVTCLVISLLLTVLLSIISRRR